MRFIGSNRPRRPIGGHPLSRFAIAILTSAIALACGKLSKDDAHAVLKSSYYDKDDSIYCAWTEYLQKPELVDGKYSYETGGETRRCVEALQEHAHALSGARCMLFTDQPCEKMVFNIREETKAEVSRGKLLFACGKKQLGSIVSIATEGRSATVKYERLVTIDKELIGRLGACQLDVPKEGLQERSAKFTKDDDGKWVAVE